MRQAHASDVCLYELERPSPASAFVRTGGVLKARPQAQAARRLWPDCARRPGLSGGRARGAGTPPAVGLKKQGQSRQDSSFH